MSALRTALRLMRTPSRALAITRGLVAMAREYGLRATTDYIRGVQTNGRTIYHDWIAAHDTLSDEDRALIRGRIDEMMAPPLISIVMPVYNVDERWLRAAIDSVQRQLYQNWELCIADDASTAPHVRTVLEEYARGDERIRIVYRQSNGHISAASNSALGIATGAFIGLLDNDDELAEHALYMVAETIAAHPDADIIYSDEDAIDEKGDRYKPHFKTDWNPDLLLGYNCISHFGVYRRALVEQIGGFRVGLEGSQDYDLVLRLSEQTEPERIHHIPFILYHWRTIPGSVATGTSAKPYVVDAARRAISEHLGRTGRAGAVGSGYRSFHRVSFAIEEPAPGVSLVLRPTADQTVGAAEIEALIAATEYPIEEIVVVQEGACVLPATIGSTRIATERERTLARLAPRLSGGVLVVIDGATAPVASDWLRELVSLALQEDIGMVGGMMLRADGTIDNCGLVLCPDAVARRAFAGLESVAPGYMYRAQVRSAVSALPAGCIAMRRELLSEDDVAQAPASGADPDGEIVAICRALSTMGLRAVWTPHTKFSTRGVVDSPDVVYSSRDQVQPNDPFYSPNLSSSGDFLPAFPPRIVRPWRDRYGAIS